MTAVVAWGGAAAAHALTVGDVIEVRRGDTFSQIAAQVTGSAQAWRHAYRPGASRLRNPDMLLPGMRLEVASDAKGRYLRVAGYGHTPTPSGDASAMRPAEAPRPAPAPAQAAPTPAPAAAVPIAAAPLPVLGAAGEFVVGVLPNVPAPTLLTQYESFKRYLEKQNPGMKVRVVVPANFKVFFDGMMAGDYDLAVAAPHFARVAQQDKGLVPLVTYEPRTNGLFVAPIDSTVKAAKDVRERPIAFANPQSLVAMYGQQWLRSNGMEPGRDYEVKGARTDMGVGRMMLINEAAAAVMSNVELRTLPAEESARMRIVEVIARIPNFILMANPAKVDRERQAKLRTQLKGLMADRDDGAEFARATGFTGVGAVDDATMKELEPFAAQTRRAMGVTK